MVFFLRVERFFTAVLRLQVIRQDEKKYVYDLNLCDKCVTNACYGDSSVYPDKY